MTTTVKIIIIITSDVLEHKWRASLKTILFFYEWFWLLTLKLLKIRSSFFYFAYTVKVLQCHSNNSLQLLELKGKNSFLCSIFFSKLVVVTHNALTQLDAPKQTYLRGSLVDNVFSSKYCCVQLIAMTKRALTYHRH